ncbi:cobalamin-binding protein [Halalkalibacter akibai]|uniref:Vitamin B12 ABC transporter n=1 Tax=Halalkalibacter akibai (strain ATCC 43226 / DSM 21942 / CIP 109018 / JCM 9157 / 1139) TaxID=1236973 RepID=W4R1C8_HALA3|nr:cobalamin-binding protein [Halalkalibacter akibai]GAE37359.1 vitamin B12 ABC transporter [Halalkalibacter akibai JCM 9157]
MRLISICPSNTELLAYLQATDDLVGIDDFSDWPLSIKNLPRLGPDLSIRMDEVEALAPDLVLASLSVPGMEKNVAELQKRGIPHVVYNPNSLKEIIENLLDLGKRINKEVEAEKTAQLYQDILHTYKQKAKMVEAVSLYWEWWPKPVFTPGKTNWLTEISQLAGGRNVYDHVELASVQTDWADVCKQDPDYICLAWVGIHTEKVKPELLWKRPDWPDLKALQANKVLILEEELYCRPSPRLLLGLKKLAAILHPDIMPNDDGMDPLLLSE